MREPGFTVGVRVVEGCARLTHNKQENLTTTQKKTRVGDSGAAANRRFNGTMRAECVPSAFVLRAECVFSAFVLRAV